MKPIVLLLLLAAACSAAPPMDCNHHHQRHGHADDANKISPAQVVEAGLKKDDIKSAEVAKTSDSLQGVVGPENKKEEIKEVKDKKLPALTKDKVDKKSTTELTEAGDKKKSTDAEKFLDLNIKNVVPKETSSSATSTKTKDDLQKAATSNAEESELADDATVAVAQQASDVLDTANKSLTAVGDALGKDPLSVDSVVVKNKTATAAITPDAAYAVAKKEVPAEAPAAEAEAPKPKAREVTNMAKAPGGVKFEVPLQDSKKVRDLPIESLKDTQGIVEPPKASQNLMTIAETDAEQGDEAVVAEAKKDLNKDLDKAKKNTDEALAVPKAPIVKDTSKTIMSAEPIPKNKDAKDTSKMMMSDEAPKEAKLDADKTNKDFKVKKSDMAPAGIQAPNKDSKVTKSANEPMMMSDEPAKVAEAPNKDAKLELDKTKTADLKAVEKKDAPIAAADDKLTPEAIVKPKTRNVSTRMMKKGLAGRNTPGFMTGSMFINV